MYANDVFTTRLLERAAIDTISRPRAAEGEMLNAQKLRATAILGSAQQMSTLCSLSVLPPPLAARCCCCFLERGDNRIRSDSREQQQQKKSERESARATKTRRSEVTGARERA